MVKIISAPGEVLGKGSVLRVAEMGPYCGGPCHSYEDSNRSHQSQRDVLSSLVADHH